MKATLGKVLNIGQINQANKQITPKKQNATRFVSVSDTHGRHRSLQSHIPPGDVFIHCGKSCFLFYFVCGFFKTKMKKSVTKQTIYYLLFR